MIDINPDIEKSIKKRITQKRRLIMHTIIYFFASIFISLAERLLFSNREGTFNNWSIVIILVWGFFFCIHAFNILVTKRFFGKQWEEKMRENLMKKQNEKITKIKDKI